MKKTIAILLALAMLFSFCACGNRKNKVDKALQGNWTLTISNDIGTAYYEYYFSNGFFEENVTRNILGQHSELHYEGVYTITDDEIITTATSLTQNGSTVHATGENKYAYTMSGKTLSFCDVNENYFQKEN